MKMKISLLFLAGGLFFIGLGEFELFKMTAKQSKTLIEAVEQVKRKDKESTAESLKIKSGEVIGLLQLPTIDEQLPIVSGVSESSLEKGVGHYEGTSLPNQNDQIVLSGHRDTVFRRLGELKIGDELWVEMPYGSYKYEIVETFIVSADDRTVIRSSAPIEKLTLTTCYPFNVIGDAPRRYIVNARRK